MRTMRDRYLLYYAGLDSPGGIEQIGLASSNDLMHWERVGSEPVIPLGSAGEFDATQTSNPCVLPMVNGWRMWYQGRSEDGRFSICVADSSDGKEWKAMQDPVFSPRLEEAGIYRAGFQHPHVLFDTRREIYRMWYVQQDATGAVIKYAESKEGITWNSLDDPVLKPELLWEGPYLYYPFVSALSDGGYELWYTGRSRGRTWQLGRALSKDGIAWKRDVRNPLLPTFLFPRSVRQAADLFGSSVPIRALNGVASANLFARGTARYMVTHEVGIRGRLSIALYEEQSGDWKRRAKDMLGSHQSRWDRYFQADPFVIEAHI